MPGTVPASNSTRTPTNQQIYIALHEATVLVQTKRNEDSIQPTPGQAEYSEQIFPSPLDRK